MQTIKRIFAIVLILVMTLTLAPVHDTHAASKKPKLSATKITLEAGKSKKLSIVKNGFYKIGKTSYRSSDTKIAKVTKTGKVTAKSVGKATITATVKAKQTKKSKTETYKLKCGVTVSAAGNQPAGKATVPDGTDSKEETTGSDDAGPAGESSVPVDTSRTDTGVKGSNILVVYFSRAGHNYVSADNYPSIEVGNTEVLAKKIISKTGADEFKINPVNPYPDDYLQTVSQANEERKAEARPAYIGDVENWSSYDYVFLGYPIWGGDMPMVVYTFLESHDWNGKTLIPFNTHAGSGQSGTQGTIQSKCSGAKVRQGIAIAGTKAQAAKDTELPELNTWLDGLNLPEKSAQTAAGQFDLQSRTVLLNDGNTMPILGIGTYALSDSEAENSVYCALKAGYRLIDTARIYGNEAGVGRGIKRAIDEGYVKRSDIFVTTKIWTADYGNPDAAINASLQRLDLDYIDLMILHHSQPSNDVDAYKAMEEAKKDGRLKSIGLSNYYTVSDFDRLVSQTTVVPALLQNETHPYHQSSTMKSHLEKYGTVMESWFPLGGRGNTQTLFRDSTVSSIAATHGKTAAQIILRWHLQAGNIAIPGSSNESHIKENVDIFDFSLSEEEMKQMTALDRNERFADY